MTLLTSAIMLGTLWAGTKIKIIGLTGFIPCFCYKFSGSICCGKSTVSKIFKKDFEIKIIDCDLIARRILERGKPAYKKILRKYGP